MTGRGGIDEDSARWMELDATLLVYLASRMCSVVQFRTRLDCGEWVCEEDGGLAHPPGVQNVLGVEVLGGYGGVGLVKS